MKDINMRDFMVCCHKWTKELTEKYKDVDYNIQLSLVMSELLRQKKNGEHNLF